MIDVLLVDDHALFRSGLARLLADEADICVRAQVANGQEALEQLRQNHFTVVILDINLRGRSGLEMLRHIRTQWPQQMVLMLSMYPAVDYAAQAMRLGACGYVAKDADAPVLLHALRTVALGGIYFPQVTPAAVLPTPTVHQPLSVREQHILRLMVRGLSLTEIGQDLCLSVKTISTYRGRILKKLGVSSNAGLVRYALQEGLID